ncbi:hypothetical protein PTTG_01239 [Puccinia triticina 1-1 BBBD Race 1]|uniref:Mediator of RNA polymerase II transcription subunit 7 n=2 Tax=Puccinia triticina TaxID=208348 RepID=A0A0C4EKG4_PUCT1|nr:uncharacterized protein PtA15_10A470 [Puccinia triticina]OAV98037.1 hypothetical protein PTTG_01239 [Puccinia triticina 1-1 BBBD Race 1]WAQ89047.1 hypothetical protein PtA15_10A470 [Puccinia triticina]
MESNEVNSSFFPPPPPRHKHFTNHNLAQARRLVSITPSESLAAPFDPSAQARILGLDEQQDSNEEQIDLRTLVHPPNLDWIRENGGWTAFGDREPWPGSVPQTSLEGMPKLYDPSLDRKQALQSLLNTLIHAYLQLLSVLSTQGPVSLAPSDPSSTGGGTGTQTDQIVSHIELAAFNIHGLCNELRPRQARETLKLMLRHQANDKRTNAARVLSTCAELREQLAALKPAPTDLLSSGNSEDEEDGKGGQDEKDARLDTTRQPSAPARSSAARYDYALLASLVPLPPPRQSST